MTCTRFSRSQNQTGQHNTLKKQSHITAGQKDNIEGRYPYPILCCNFTPPELPLPPLKLATGNCIAIGSTQARSPKHSLHTSTINLVYKTPKRTLQALSRLVLLTACEWLGWAPSERQMRRRPCGSVSSVRMYRIPLRHARKGKSPKSTTYSLTAMHAPSASRPTCYRCPSCQRSAMPFPFFKQTMANGGLKWFEWTTNEPAEVRDSPFAIQYGLPYF